MYEVAQTFGGDLTSSARESERQRGKDENVWRSEHACGTLLNEHAEADAISWAEPNEGQSGLAQNDSRGDRAHLNRNRSEDIRHDMAKQDSRSRRAEGSRRHDEVGLNQLA